LTRYTCARNMCSMARMNLTLSVDERILIEARKTADAMGKSLNQLVREYLEHLTFRDRPEDEVEEFRRLSSGGRRKQGWKFSRDDIHERS
jgi:hypothetical protein